MVGGSALARTVDERSRALGAEARSALATDAAAELLRTDANARLSFATALGLPRLAAPLGKEGAPLFAVFIDDDLLRPTLGEPALEVWLPLDAAACAGKALAHADAWTVEMLVTLCLSVDPAEAYDAIADRYRVDARLRTHLGNRSSMDSVRRVLRDERFVDLALAFMAQEPLASVGMLGLQGSRRAVDELHAVIDGAEHLTPVVAAALEGLQVSAPREETVDALARVLSRPLGDEFVAAQGPLHWLVYRECDELLAHELVRSNDDAVRRVNTIRGPRRVRALQPVG